ncbi:MAG: hypothetical protein ISQ32_02905 [Rickettsiales bacterium]|nr:hypothetical protein [Rickettsiales bacterium]
MFELIAGGALPICDENPFFKQHFGDKVLYVNGSDKEKAIQINAHYNWALNNKNSVKGMVEILQKHMKANFDLSKQIKNLYDKHKQRRELIEQEYHARNKNFVINIIHVQEKSDNLKSIIDSVKNQSYPLIKLFIVSNIRDPETLSLLKRNDINYTFLEYNSCKLNNFGKVIAEIEPKLPSSENDLFLISRFGEDFFYDHLSSLVRVLEDNPNCQLAESSVIMYDNNEFGIYVNNIEFAPHLSDHMFYTGSMLIRSLPPSYILKYLNQRNYINSLNNHFEHKIKTNTPTMKYNISHHKFDQYNDNTLCNSLTTETIITKPINTNLENVLNSKENAYKILSHIKFLRPIIKLRNQIKKLKRKI